MSAGLRHYQQAAVRAAVEQLRTCRSTLITMPTGTGKTQVFVSMAGLARGRTLILAHRDELVSQAAVRVAQMLGAERCPDVEKADRHARTSSRIVVGSVQTLHGKRLKAWSRDQFSLLIIDEAHHATASGYREVVNHFEAAKVVGVTATPDRTDAEALGQVFDSVAFSYELPQAITDGWLVRPKLFRVKLEHADLSGVHTRAGDLAANELEEQIGAEDVLREIATAILEEAGGRKTLAYTPLVRSAYRLAQILCELAGGPVAKAVDGSTPADERRAILAGHDRGDFRVLCNCMVLTEGYDSPSVSCVAVARPTKSRSLYTQMVGRGLRLSPGKADCLILDFGGCSRRLDLVGPEDILGGDERVVAEAKNKEPSDNPVDVMDELEAAQRDLTHRVEEADALARRQRARGPGKGLLSADVTERILGLEPSRGTPWSRPASERQIAALAHFGVDASDLVSRDRASDLLDALIRRAKGGLATMKQIALLERLGWETSHVRVITMEDASCLIDSRLPRRGYR